MSKRWLSAVAGVAAVAAMAGTAFAKAPPPVMHPTSVKTVTPVLTMPVRDLPRMDLPGLMQRIVGTRHLTQQQLEQLRDKLIASGYLDHSVGNPYTIPLKKLTPVQTRPLGHPSPTLQAQIGQGQQFSTGVVFPGIGVSDTPSDPIGCAPPDTDSAVGGGYVVEIVNTCGTSPGVGTFKVWDTSGNVVQGSTALGSLWSTSDCQNGGGDNNVSYDQFANRWIMSQFNSSYTGICVAVSTSSDPTGSYNLYNVVMDAGGFTDYPKTGIWVTGDDNSDAYLISANDFPPASCGNCVVYTAAQRSAMLNGDTATIITFIGPPYTSGLDYSALPSDVDGMSMPPLDDPGMFVDYISPWYYGGSTYALEMWQMTPDFGTPANSTLTGPTAFNVTPFQDGDITCAPQPSPGECLPLLGDRLMYRLAYRNGNNATTDQILLANHAVTADGGSSAPIGIDWYELTAPAGETGTNWTVAQDAVYAPADGNSRWMASISMDIAGNIGMGYTISGPSLDPSIAVTGQNYGAPSGEMDAGESTLIAGTGVQQSTGRWGDYSSIMTDPSDDCTFWTAQEYISETGSFHWSTGNGSFKFDTCASGPSGTLTGVVTDANTGDPLGGAKVTLTPGGHSGTSDNTTGVYTVVSAPGTYTAAATKFGYQESDATVNLTDGGTTNQDFALTPSETAKLHGVVYDGGHQYPLFAEVKVKNNGTTVADVWTSAANGHYSVTLPTGAAYTVTATPYLSGFTAGSASVTLSGDTTQSFALTPDSSCTAPGYHYTGGVSQDFDGGTFPPDGWSVTNDVSGSIVVWEPSSEEPFDNGNYTGGTGDAADADSNDAGPGVGAYDTSLITPPIDVSSLSGTTLKWLESFIIYSGNEALDVDISTDGGSTWNNVQHQTSDCGDLYTDGCSESLDLSSVLPGSGTFQLRWRYYNLVSDYDWYAQVDNVLLGAQCQAIPGQLVNLGAIDANSHDQLTGVTVTDENNNSAVTVANPSGGPPGAVMFEPSGDHTLTATKNNYQDAVKDVTVGGGSNFTKTVVFWMKAGQLAVQPQSLTVNATVDQLTNVQLHIGNTGSAPVDWQLGSIDAPPAQPNNGHGAPFAGVHCQDRASSASFGSKIQPGDCGIGDDAPGRNSNDSTWAPIADFPIPIADNCMATDESTGLVYSFAGVSGGAVIASSYVYDPGSDSWTAITSVPAALEKPACAAIGGKLYVAAGWDALGNSNQTLYIYDPGSDTWSTGADEPNPHAGGPGMAVLNGQFYVIGGCADSFCDATDVVDAYDPSSDSWTTLANYPHLNAWQFCGGIGSEVYCAGGTAGGSFYGDGYAYDPGTDSWTAIASLPNNSFGCNDLWGGGGVGASGQLLAEDGVTCSGFDIINEGFAYDPGSDSWSALPNSLVSDYRMGSACGFYMVGGSPFNGSTVGQVLPGYDTCTVGAVPWLSFNPASGTLAAKSMTSSTLTIDGTGQTGGTSETVTVTVSGNTPYGGIVVPLTVHWQSAGPTRKH